jgi:phosphoserine phosphatase RsbU/P
MSNKASIKRYKLSTFKLNALLEVTQTINENKSVDGLLARYEKILKEDLSIGKILIFKFQESWECILKSGLSDFDEKTIDVQEVLLPFEEISFITSSQNQLLSNFDIVIPVITNNKAMAFVLIGDIDEESEGVSPTIKHLNFIHTLSNIIIVAIENIRLFNQSLRQEAIRKELELASRMQSMLIPENKLLPNTAQLHISAFYHPHLEVGGDYYDCIKLSNHEYGFCIADVSGKGISAAILMSNFQANLRALFSYGISLAALVEKLNERVMYSAKGEKFITLFVGKYNTKTKELEYVNAGHNPPVLYQVESGKMEYLKSGCVGMGMLDELPFVKSGRILINERTKIICYTDGLVELVEKDLVELDTIEIENCISNGLSIEENIKTLIQKQGIMESNQAIFDDISILGLEIF